MDKVLSARVDETVMHRIGDLARRLHTSKKRIIEEAVRSYAARVDEDEKSDVFERTAGAWDREESPDQLVEAAREAFRKGMERYR